MGEHERRLPPEDDQIAMGPRHSWLADLTDDPGLIFIRVLIVLAALTALALIIVFMYLSTTPVNQRW